MEANVEERLEDVFQDEIIKKFATTPDFVKFAKSKHGLRLDHHDVQHTVEDNRFSVEEQKTHLLEKWRQNQGAAASPKLIRDTVDNYLKAKQVKSDATQEGERESSPDPEDPQESTAPKQAKGMEGVETVNVFNINAPINAPFIAGNREVNLGAGVAAPGPPAIDPDIPAMKPSTTEISPQGTTIEIGSCILDFSPSSVREATITTTSNLIDPGPPPDGYIHATSAISCSPPVECRKPAKVVMGTWCSTEESLGVGVFSKNNEGDWETKEEVFLTEEGHLELYYRSIDNLAVFVPANRVNDIKFKISCFLFNDADGKFAIGFCLADKAIENIFRHRLKKEHPYESIADLDPMFARVGDEVYFKITPGQEMQNTKLDINQEFLADFRGHISYCQPNKDCDSAYYEVTQKRDGIKVYELKKQIPGKNADNANLSEKFSGQRASVEFRGNVRADNFFGSVENADIDQRSYGDHSDEDSEERPFWQSNDNLTWEEKKKRALKKKEDLLGRLRKEGKLSNDPRRRTGGTKVTFHGDVDAKTMITDAKNVRIDQRRFKGKRGKKTTTASKVEKLVKAEQESSGAGNEDEDSSEGRQEPRAEAGEEADADDKAQPIWDDCEKKGSGENSGSSKETEVSETLREKSTKDNSATPIWEDCDPKRPPQNQEPPPPAETDEQPEVDVRRRKEQRKQEREEAERKTHVKRVGTKSIDALHITLFVLILICICIVYFK